MSGIHFWDTVYICDWLYYLYQTFTQYLNNKIHRNRKWTKNISFALNTANNVTNMTCLRLLSE